MKLIFVSNYLNHHQVPLCEAFYSRSEEFYFVATDTEHQQGYQTSIAAPYVLEYDGRENQNRINALIMTADVVIFGSCPNALIDMRMAENKLSFLYSERFLKKGLWRRFIPTTRKKIYDRILKHRDKNMYVLCASAYLPYELKLLRFPIEKCFQWGYFPQTKRYEDVDALIANKETGSILWAGRLLDVKHPYVCLPLAEYLKSNNYKYRLNIIGEGPLKSNLEQEIHDRQLGEYVHLLGSKTPVEVRKYMEESRIFLFTSDFREGWGAVLNEAMNSGCAVVSSHTAGATPFLIQHEKNGLIYPSGDMKKLVSYVEQLLLSPELCGNLGAEAYRSVTENWNGDVAAERLIALAMQILKEKNIAAHCQGPCMIAEVRKNGWV